MFFLQLKFYFKTIQKQNRNIDSTTVKDYRHIYARTNSHRNFTTEKISEPVFGPRKNMTRSLSINQHINQNELNRNNYRHNIHQSQDEENGEEVGKRRTRVSTCKFYNL